MYNNRQLALRWWQHYKAAANSKGHGTHSPFVFSFIKEVLNNQQGSQPPAAIEALRQYLKKDKTLLPIQELGAGSRRQNSTHKTIAHIAQTAVKPSKWSGILYRLAAWQQPQNIVELGTSLGITTAHLATACPQAQVHTIEGSPAVCAVARNNFQQLGLKNVVAWEGAFDAVLPQVLQQLPHIDLAYIDGNHRYEPTIAYFQQLLSGRTDDSVFIFDDIHWSASMEKAWEEIKAHPDVRCSIDLFFMGFVFFNKSFKVPQQFSIRTSLLP